MHKAFQQRSASAKLTKLNCWHNHTGVPQPLRDLPAVALLRSVRTARVDTRVVPTWCSGRLKEDEGILCSAILSMFATGPLVAISREEGVVLSPACNLLGPRALTVRSSVKSEMPV